MTVTNRWMFTLERTLICLTDVFQEHERDEYMTVWSGQNVTMKQWPSALTEAWMWWTAGDFLLQKEHDCYEQLTEHRCTMNSWTTALDRTVQWWTLNSWLSSFVIMIVMNRWPSDLDKASIWRKRDCHHDQNVYVTLWGIEYESCRHVTSLGGRSYVTGQTVVLYWPCY